LFATLLTAALLGQAAAEPVPLPRPRPDTAQPPAPQPLSFRAAAGPDFDSAAVTAEPTDCDQRLATIAKIETMPRLIGPGPCGGADMVRMRSVLLADGKRVALQPSPYLRCPMAEQFAGWIRETAAPQVAAIGEALRRVETYDDYECRLRNRLRSGKISEHAKANAIDVRGFTLAGGRFIALTDPAAPKPLREALREAACARFTTVLGPGEANHESHIHLDLLQRRNGYRICQWAVREPPKPETVEAKIPLPVPRPAGAGSGSGGDGRHPG
jgi:hypothetical protein